jgi:site-specific recombinase XerD
MDTIMVFGHMKVRLFQRNDQPSNNWFMRCSVEGKQFRRSLKTCVLEEARKAVAGQMVDLLAKQKVGQKVFGTALEEFRKEYLLELQRRVERGDLSRLTLKKVNRYLERGMEFIRSQGVLKSAAVDAVDREVWGGYADWRLKDTKMRLDVINQELVTIRAGFEWAKKKGWCTDRNIPKWDFKPEKQQATRVKLTPQEFNRARRLIRRWVSAAKDKRIQKLREMVMTVFETIAAAGLRSGECLKLTRKDIQVGRDELILTVRDVTSKVRKSRQVPLLHSTTVFLRNWLQMRPDLKPDDLVFALGDANDASVAFYRQYTQLRKDVFESEGLGHVDVYHARHQAITNWLMAGESVHLVAKLAGTSVAQIEKTYSGVIDVTIGREFAKRKLLYKDDGSFEIIERDTE